jgi:DNA-binding FadR family transcriptional regulator
MGPRDGLSSPATAARPVRRQQLADQVLQQLRTQIAAGDFAVGERLPSEPQLMEQFSVGRTTIREAIRVLAASGQVEVRQGSGTYVRAATPSAGNSDLTERLRSARVREVYQVRRALEVEVVRTAALTRDGEDLARIRSLIDQLHENFRTGSKGAFRDADIELYATLAASTKNVVLIDLYRSFSQALKDAVTQVMVFPGVMRSCIDRHERVYQAIVEHDSQTAEVVTKQFLERVNNLIEDLLGGGSLIADTTRDVDDALAAPVGTATTKSV